MRLEYSSAYRVIFENQSGKPVIVRDLDPRALVSYLKSRGFEINSDYEVLHLEDGNGRIGYTTSRLDQFLENGQKGSIYMLRGQRNEREFTIHIGDRSETQGRKTIEAVINYQVVNLGYEVLDLMRSFNSAMSQTYNHVLSRRDS